MPIVLCVNKRDPQKTLFQTSIQVIVVLYKNLMYEKMQNYRAVISLWNMHYALDAVLGAAEAK